MQHSTTSYILLALPALVVGACDPDYEPADDQVNVVAKDPAVQAVAAPPDGDGDQLTEEAESSGGGAPDERPVGEVAASTAPQEGLNDDFSAEPPEVAGGTVACGITGYLDGCTWERATVSSGTQASVDCSAGGEGWAAAGGCFTGSSARLQSSYAYENQDPGNIVDAPDSLQDADGWTCVWDAGPGTANHNAIALCCGVRSNGAICI